jgi:hypothetical protein
MNRIESLRMRLEGLEGKKQRATLVRALLAYDKDVAQVATDLGCSIAAASIIASTFGAGATKSVGERLSELQQRTSRVATTLAKKLRAEAAYAGSNKAGDAISDLKGNVAAAKKSVTEAWAKGMADRCALIQARLAVAEVAAANEVSQLRVEMGRIAVIALPMDGAEAKGVREFFARAESNLAKVGGSLRLSAFVDAAMRGSASAADLEDSEVRGFLDTYKLWPRITVKLT